MELDFVPELWRQPHKVSNPLLLFRLWFVRLNQCSIFRGYGVALSMRVIFELYQLFLNTFYKGFHI